jgi:hypothetical protein
MEMLEKEGLEMRERGFLKSIKGDINISHLSNNKILSTNIQRTTMENPTLKLMNPLERNMLGLISHPPKPETSMIGKISIKSIKGIPKRVVTKATSRTLGGVNQNNQSNLKQNSSSST